MSDQATLAIVHFDSKSQDLKEFAKSAVAANKGHGKGAKFMTFVPVHGPKNVAYVWFPHASHSELEAGAHPVMSDAHGHDEAKTMATSAKGGVKGVGTVMMKRTASGHREAGKVPNYLVTYGVKIEPGKMGQFQDAAKAFVEANAKSAKPISFGVHRPADMTSGARLIVLGVDSLSELDDEGLLNHARLSDHEGADAAKTTAGKLNASVKGARRQVLRYLPEYSHA
jgi:hypothetical protein